jgi:hypothetical protein
LREAAHAVRERVELPRCEEVPLQQVVEGVLQALLLLLPLLVLDSAGAVMVRRATPVDGASTRQQ